jgi:hypothetical protein
VVGDPTGDRRRDHRQPASLPAHDPGRQTSLRHRRRRYLAKLRIGFVTVRQALGVSAAVRCLGCHAPSRHARHAVTSENFLGATGWPVGVGRRDGGALLPDLPGRARKPLTCRDIRTGQHVSECGEPHNAGFPRVAAAHYTLGF